MPDVMLDLTGHDDDEFDVENTMVFDLRISGQGVTIDLSYEQAKSIFYALWPYFEEEKGVSDEVATD